MTKIHLLFYAITLGIAAAMPIGPVNMEIIRRNLQYNTRAGILLGFGASCTDLTYVMLLCMGAITLLSHTLILHIVTVIGALVLAWLGLSALTIKADDIRKNDQVAVKTAMPLWKHWRDGYIMTAFNPMTILFWTSVSSQVANLSNRHYVTVAVMASGIIIGAFGWALGLNAVLHFTRHRISAKITHRLNQLGGILLLGFAAYGLIVVFSHLR